MTLQDIALNSLVQGRFLEAMRVKGYKVARRPYELNIVGVRAKGVAANTFNDQIHVFFKLPSGLWSWHIYQATTDPGAYWLKNPAAPKGTAYLVQGQYLDAFKIGLHQGKYEALVQAKPVEVVRGSTRTGSFGLTGVQEWGMFGINIHRAAKSGKSYGVDKYSAGCQVFQDPADFNQMLGFARKHRELYGNSFTYTLLDYRATNAGWVVLFSKVSIALTLLYIALEYVLPFLKTEAPSKLKTRS